MTADDDPGGVTISGSGSVSCLLTRTSVCRQIFNGTSYGGLICSWLSDSWSSTLWLPKIESRRLFPLPYSDLNPRDGIWFVRVPLDLPLEDPIRNISCSSVQVKGRFATMIAVEDSRMYQNVHSEPNGLVKLYYLFKLADRIWMRR
jgi:hypothetical protein